MTIPPRNRVLDLLLDSTLNGIDYVEASESDPKLLYVHFFNSVDVTSNGVDIRSMAQLKASISGGDRIPTVPVDPIQANKDWNNDDEGRLFLTLHVPGRGDFSAYTLKIEGDNPLDPWLDPHFRQVQFSFYAFCPSLVDCQPIPEFCPPSEEALPPIDYLAKDYDSFRQALSDFSAQRFPEWRERAEADFGVMFMEALSAIGDDLSYLQDRIHQEAAIETATERRSLERLARMVDYAPRPITSAYTLLQCKVASITQLPAGILVMALAPDGSEVPFETGTGLRDETQYPVNAAWYEMAPYWWDDSERCLGIGATSMYLEGQGYGLVEGLRLLIDTTGSTSADPPVRELVTLVNAEELLDPLYSTPVTRIEWRPEDALKRYHDLTRTTVKGNLVPATQGRRYREHFAIPIHPESDSVGQNPDVPLSIERLGSNSTAATPCWQSLFTLRQYPVAYLEQSSSGLLEPEIILTRISAPPGEWSWVPSLLEAGAFEKKFTLEPAAWRPVLQTANGTAYDYDGSQGATVRFGDGAFGELPEGGDRFEVRYRTSRGKAGNVAPDTITAVDPAWSRILLEATNPLAAEGGDDAETDEQIRWRAPFAFRNTTFCAVRTEDYDAAVSGLSWVQRAGTVFRWTGSWPTIFTSVDPKNTGVISPDQHLGLIQLLNRYRLAGYECYAPSPRYVSCDIFIQVCARPDAFQGEVYAGLQHALNPVRYPDGAIGFFHVDNFTLGTPFERSRLEASIQAVDGVAGVLSIQYRRRGYLNTDTEMPPRINFAPGEIFRLDNNASRPECGSYRLEVKGGK